MMTMDEFENKLELILNSDTGADCTVVFDELIAHDDEQRAVIERYRKRVAAQAKEISTLKDNYQREMDKRDAQTIKFGQRNKTLREALQNCLTQIQEDIKECGPCEHDVNICICHVKILAAEAQQALREVS